MSREREYYCESHHKYNGYVFYVDEIYDDANMNVEYAVENTPGKKEENIFPKKNSGINREINLCRTIPPKTLSMIHLDMFTTSHFHLIID